MLIMIELFTSFLNEFQVALGYVVLKIVYFQTVLQSSVFLSSSTLGLLVFNKNCTLVKVPTCFYSNSVFLSCCILCIPDNWTSKSRFVLNVSLSMDMFGCFWLVSLTAWRDEHFSCWSAKIIFPNRWAFCFGIGEEQYIFWGGATGPQLDLFHLETPLEHGRVFFLRHCHGYWMPCSILAACCWPCSTHTAHGGQTKTKQKNPLSPFCRDSWEKSFNSVLSRNKISGRMDTEKSF